MKFRPGTFDVKAPKSDGWSEASSDLVELGRRMDQAMLGLREVRAAVQANYEVRGDQLSGRAAWRIRNTDVFHVEYYLPETKGTLNRLVSDGTSRAEYFRNEWRRPVPPPSAPLSDQAAADWPLQSMRLALGTYLGSPGQWERVFSAWKAGKGGVKATVERRTQTVRGEERTVFRVLATTSTGGATTTEVLIDGKRYLPGSLRFDRTRPDGAKDRLMWSIEWGFGGKHEARDFAVPVNLSAQPSSSG